MFPDHQILTLEWFLKDRDTEDWSNDVENSVYSHRKQINYITIISHIFYCIFDQNNAALMSRIF